MKKENRIHPLPLIFAALTALTLFFVVMLYLRSFASDSAIEIHSISQLNCDTPVADSHAGKITRSIVEMDYRSYVTLDEQTLGTGTAHYPRMLALADGTYMLIYNSARTGPDVMYVTSSDRRTWSSPKMLFTSDATYQYATCDGVVLSDGTVIVCAAKRPASGNWNAYATDPNSTGLFVRRSTDHGKTWSDEQRVATGTVWEPSLLQTNTGELQIYYTNVSPYIYYYEYDNEVRSSFSSLIRSYDGGYTWTPDINSENVDESDPYAGWRVMQEKVGDKSVTDRFGNTLTVPYYNDQMPVARQLNNGAIVVSVEEFDYFNVHPTFGGHYTVSLGFSYDNWAKRLGLHETGPAERYNDIDRAAGPYINQFPSGEVILSHTNSSTSFEVKVGDADAHRFNPELNFNLGTKNLWSSTCILDSHRMAGISDDGNNTANAEAGTMTLGYAEFVLDHDIDAKRQYTTVDGDNRDWSENTDALFVGSISQAQMSLRSAYDDSYVYFLVEVLDKYISSSDYVRIAFATAANTATYYSVDVGPNGLVKKNFSGTPTVSKYVNGTVGKDTDTDVGYLVEVRIAKSNLTSVGFSNQLYVLPTLYNTDGSTTYSADSLTGASINTSGKAGCPIITYHTYQTFDTVYVGSNGNNCAFGNTPENAVASLVRAFEIVNDGGRVVLISDVSLTSAATLGKGDGSVTLTSLRGTEKLLVGASMTANCDLTVENLTMSVTAGNCFLYMQYHDLHICDSVTCTLNGSTTYMAIQAGFYAENATKTYAALCSDRDCTIRIDGGTWRYIRGGNRRNGTTAPLGHYSGDSVIVINGGSFMATSEGTSQDVSSPTGMNSFSGTNRMIINGGLFKGEIYAQSRSGGIDRTANGFTSTPDYSGRAEIVVTGGTFEKKICAKQVLGNTSGDIVFASRATTSVSYADPCEKNVNKANFDQTASIGGYAIPVSGEVAYVDINGICPTNSVYGGKLYIPASFVTERSLMTVSVGGTVSVYLMEPDGKTWQQLSLGELFPRYIGTSIRVVSAAGLRFKTQVNTNVIGDAEKICRVGAIAAFKDKLGNLVLTRSTACAGESVAYDADTGSSHWFSDDADGQVYTAVLTGFTSNEYQREVTYRPYVEILYGGKHYTLYGEAVTRSIYGVAKQCVGKDSLYPFVQELITHVDGLPSGDVPFDFFS